MQFQHYRLRVIDTMLCAHHVFESPRVCVCVCVSVSLSALRTNRINSILLHRVLHFALRRQGKHMQTNTRRRFRYNFTSTLPCPPQLEPGQQYTNSPTEILPPSYTDNYPVTASVQTHLVRATYSTPPTASNQPPPPRRRRRRRRDNWVLLYLFNICRFPGRTGTLRCSDKCAKRQTMEFTDGKLDR